MYRWAVKLPLFKIKVDLLPPHTMPPQAITSSVDVQSGHKKIM